MKIGKLSEVIDGRAVLGEMLEVSGEFDPAPVFSVSHPENTI